MNDNIIEIIRNHMSVFNNKDEELGRLQINNNNNLFIDNELHMIYIIIPYTFS